MTVFDLRHGLADDATDFLATVERVLGDICTPERTARWDREAEFPWEVYEQMVALGWLALPFGEEVGGTGAPLLWNLLLNEQLYRFGVAILDCVLPGTAVVSANGPDRARPFVEALIAGKARCCLAMSEPDAGSDVGSLRTQARATDGGFVVNGSKTYTSGAHVATHMLLFARTGDLSGPRVKELSCLLVPMDLPGIEVNPLDQLGHRAYHANEVALQDVEVPADALLGAPGDGWGIVKSLLNKERIMYAAGCIGTAIGALEEAGRYGMEREQSGRPVLGFQALQHMFSGAVAQTEAARALVLRSGEMADAGIQAAKYGAMAKLVASENAVAATRVAMQVCGGFGYMMEAEAQRFYRDAKLEEIAGGTSQMQLNLIGRMLGLPAT